MTGYLNKSKFLALLLIAGWLATPSAASEPAEAGHTVATLAETATAMVAPDLLTVTMRVETTGGRPENVQAELNARVSQAVAKAKSLGDVKVTTGSYAVFQTWQPPPAAGDAPPPRWQAQQSIFLEAKTFEAVLKLAGELQEAGLLMAGISPTLSPALRRETEDRLVGEAIGKVRSQAEGVANAMGMKIEFYRSIRIDKGGAVSPVIRPMMARTANAVTPPTAEPADQAVSVTVGADVVLARP